MFREPEPRLQTNATDIKMRSVHLKSKSSFSDRLPAVKFRIIEKLLNSILSKDFVIRDSSKA